MCVCVRAYFWIASSYVVSFRNQKRTLYGMKKTNFAQPKMTSSTVNNLTQYEKHCATFDKYTFAFGVYCFSLSLIRCGCAPFRNSKFSNTEMIHRECATQRERKSHRTVSSLIWVHCVLSMVFLYFATVKCVRIRNEFKHIQTRYNHRFFLPIRCVVVLTGPGTLLL